MAALTVSEAEERRLKRMGFLNNRDTDNFSARVITLNGRVSAEQMHCLADAAHIYGNGTLLMTGRLSVEIQGIPYEKTEEFRKYLEDHGLTTGGTGAKVRPIVSCKGTTCHYGLTDTYDLAKELHERFFTGYRDVVLPHKFKMAVGGCANNCVKPTLNDLGIIAQRIPHMDPQLCRNCKECKVEDICPAGAAKVKKGRIEINTEKCAQCGRCVTKCNFDAVTGYTDGYYVYIGGRWGKKQAAGRRLDHFFTSREEVVRTVEKTILYFRENGLPGERFATTLRRTGFAVAEAQILEDDILNRKKEILALDRDEAIHLVRC